MIQAFLDLKDLHRVFDAATGVLEQTLGTPICMSNCGRCCMQNTPTASVIEGINMTSFLMGRGGKVLKRAVESAEEWLLEKHKSLTLYDGIPVGFQQGKILQEWAEISKKQCPFLAENSECIIHEVRPLVCRAYGVFRDVEMCPRPLGRGETYESRGIIDSSGVRPLVKKFYKRCKNRKAEWVLRGFVPTVLFRVARPQKFQEYIIEKRIASAKLMGTETDTTLMWQPQLDDLRAGKTPMEVLQADYVYDMVT